MSGVRKPVTSPTQTTAASGMRGDFSNKAFTALVTGELRRIGPLRPVPKLGRALRGTGSNLFRSEIWQALAGRFGLLDQRNDAARQRRIDAVLQGEIDNHALQIIDLGAPAAQETAGHRRRRRRT